VIGKVIIENYRSFGDRTEVKLRKFNVLVGPNNSGKSNFLDFLSFISDLVKTRISDALRRRGGYRAVVFNGEEDRDIRFSIEAELNGRPLKYKVVIGGEELLEEELEVEGKVLIKGKEGQGQYWNEGKKEYIEYGLEDNLALNALTRDVSPLQLKLRDFLQRIKIYRFELPKLRVKARIQRATELEEDGSNLSQVLHYIRNSDREAYEEIEERLRAAIPEIKYLETPPTEDGKASLEVVERHLSKRVDISEMSDGALWLIAHLCVFSLPRPPSLACFEEPSAFVHPRILELLIDVFKSVESQVIVTTHNPIFVNSCEPEDLIIFEKHQGKTEVKRIERPEEMKERIIRDIPLGEIWYSGEIGGVPDVP